MPFLSWLIRKENSPTVSTQELAIIVASSLVRLVVVLDSELREIWSYKDIWLSGFFHTPFRSVEVDIQKLIIDARIR